MIICNQHRFVYIDVPKTGSNSLDRLFVQYGGVLVPPENAGGTRKHRREIPEYARDYDIIVSVRNPYDRIVSQYYFYKNVIGWFEDLSFEEFIDKFLENLATEEKYAFFPIWKYLEPIGKPTHVIRLEHVVEDLQALSFCRVGKIAHTNQTKKKGTIDFSPVEIEKINQWAGQDFELFGYMKRNLPMSFLAWQNLKRTP